ncbi:MAG: hydantoinase/carbamoylase family amidase, partial [Actinomycetota bacterium]|nr:hydantoinase/carbamoylase family amidase [Actinomycetota bacterium]
MLSVNSDRLLGRIDELAAIGAIEGTQGSCRLALTPEDGAGRDLVATWMRDLGMEVAIDGIGNVVAMLPGLEPGAPVMTGSHIDTVRTGGRYDGNLGVIAGLEVVETLLDAGVTPRRPIAVAFFSDEEGARFAPDMMGSLVYVGGLSMEAALDTIGIDGTVLGHELEAIGYRGGAPCPGPPPHAFVELHVEQGPVLEAEGITIGAVTGVQGISWTEYTVRGQANHAGTTPMALRHDAGYVAARIAAHVREVARDLGGAQVGTVGKIDLHPSLVNVVAESATFTVDLRNTDDDLLCRAEGEVARHAAFVAAAEGCELDMRELARFDPVVFDEAVVAAVENGPLSAT